MKGPQGPAGHFVAAGHYSPVGVPDQTERLRSKISERIDDFERYPLKRDQWRELVPIARDAGYTAEELHYGYALMRIDEGERDPLPTKPARVVSHRTLADALNRQVNSASHAQLKKYAKAFGLTRPG